MPKVGKYCKAYPIARFREYKGWAEKAENVKKDHLYLQENYVVTDGIFMDERVVFDDVTPEWIDFCKNTLKFEVPVYDEPVMAKNEENR